MTDDKHPKKVLDFLKKVLPEPKKPESGRLALDRATAPRGLPDCRPASTLPRAAEIVGGEH